jgi:hypothetical protein
MPAKREVLASLTRDELLDALDRCGVEVGDRRVKEGLVEALAASHRARRSDILGTLPRERLKELCRRFDLDDSGRQKVVLVERLAGRDASRPEESSDARPRRPRSARVAGTAAPPTIELSTNELEKRLWASADALRNNMDAAEYKHVVLGLIFLKYISDAFEAKHAELVSEAEQGADPEDPDEYRAASIFWVPKEARWAHLKANAPQPTIGKLVDDAMTGIERDNPSLKGVLPRDYGRPGLDKQRLGQLINLVSDIGLGSPANRAKDILGHVYEYFLAQFASAEGKKGGQFYTPSHVVRVLVEILAPYKGRVYDPCCGSGGMFVSSEKFIEAHSGKIGDTASTGRAGSREGPTNDCRCFPRRESTSWQDDGKGRLLTAVTELSQAFALAVPSDEALRIRDDVGFFQAVRSVLAKNIPGERKTDEELDHAIRQIVAKAMVSEEVVDIFAAAGLKKPDISILSDEFLAEVRGMPQRNLAVELLRRLLSGEIRTRRRKNLVQARSFADLLEQALRRYQVRAVETAQVIEELIQLAKHMRQADARGEELGLSDDEVAFYDALETNDSAVKVLGEPTLKQIARELVAAVRKNVTIDWTMRENVRAQLRVLVKRILRRYGYPPDKQEKATETVLKQAELLGWEIAA